MDYQNLYKIMGGKYDGNTQMQMLLQEVRQGIKELKQQTVGLRADVAELQGARKVQIRLNAGFEKGLLTPEPVAKRSLLDIILGR